MHERWCMHKMEVIEMSERPGDCTTKDRRCFFFVWMLVWIFSIAIFAHEIGRQTRYDRTTGTVVDISHYATGKSNHNHPIVEFVAEGEEFSFMSDVEAGTGTTYKEGAQVVVVYDPGNPGKDPEILEVSRRSMIFARGFALFTTQIAICALLYFSCTGDSLGQNLGLNVPFAPRPRPNDCDEQMPSSCGESNVELAYQAGVVA
ncbi:hypothetical protein ACHAXT_000224 [Thalassiosira profunda]